MNVGQTRQNSIARNKVDPGKVEPKADATVAKTAEVTPDSVGPAAKVPASQEVQQAARGTVAAADKTMQAKLAGELKTNQATQLQADAEKNGLKSNQDLINHGYQQSTQGLKNSDENFAKAGEYLKQNYNVDINNLVKNRTADIAGLKKQESATSNDGFKDAPKAGVNKDAATSNDGFVDAPKSAEKTAQKTAQPEAPAAPTKTEAAPQTAETSPAAPVSKAHQEIAAMANAAEKMGVISPALRKGLSDGDISRADFEGADAAYVAAQGKTNAVMANGSSAAEAQALSGQAVAAELFSDAAREHFRGAGASPETMQQVEQGLSQVDELEKADQAVHGLSVQIKKGIGR